MESPSTPSAHEAGVSRPSEKEALSQKGKAAKAQPRSWRPASLSTPSLVCIIVLSLVFLVGIEVLAQRSKAQNGLALARSTDEISQTALVASRYLPTLLVTFFALIWSWVDLDIKRMQPWVELSKSGGESAKNTVLLDYPSMFIVTAPYTALKKRHWTVFVSGTAVLAILFVLTPIQGAIFGVAETAQSRNASVSSRLQLMPTSEQRLSQAFLHEAYAIGWVNMSYPAFATSEYALLPFSLDDEVVPSGVSRNWSAETTKFWAETTCSSATLEQKNKTSPIWAVSEKYGCIDKTALNDFGDNRPTIGYTDNVLGGFGGDGYFNCSANPEDYYIALIYWGIGTGNSSSDSSEATGSTSNFTALFCEVTYHQQQVLATVAVPDLQPIDDEMTSLSEPTQLLKSDFNSSLLQGELGAYADWGYWNYTDNQNDYASLRVAELNVTLTQYYMVDGMTDNDWYAYSNSSRLERLFSDMQKRLFALAILQLTTDQTVLAPADTGSATFNLSGVLVSRPFAAVAEGILALLALGTAWILYSTRTSHCALPTIPSSVGQLLDLIHDSPEAAKLLWPADTADDKALAKLLEHRRFQLIVNASSKHELVCVHDAPDSPEEKKVVEARGYYVPVKPWILRKPTGSVIILFLVGSLVSLAYLKSAEQKYNGLKLRSNSFFVRQLLESYLPTVLVAMIKPMWMLLTRAMCVFQPFLDLWAGRASASKSVDATYASLPSHAVLFKAVTKGHLLLGLLCFITLLANLLAIGISVLFNENAVTITRPQTLQPLYSESFNTSAISSTKNQLQLVRSDAIDHLWLTWANMTHNTPLPAWLSDDYFFMPHSTDGLSSMASDDTLTLAARGFGANTNCTAGSTENLPHIMSFDAYYNYTRSLPKAEQKKIESVCGNRSITTLSTILDLYDGRSTEATGPSALQVYIPFLDSTPDGDCEPPFVVAWAKTPSLKTNGTVNSTYVICRPTFETAMFNVTIDKEGRVLRHERTSSLQSDLGYSSSYNDTRNLLKISSTALVSEQLTARTDSKYGLWQNVTKSSGWMSQFTYLQTGNTDSGDPSRPVPDSKEMVPVINKIFARTFAAYLSTHTDLFQEKTSSESTAGVRMSEETRVFMDKTAFIICVCVLSLDLLVALLFYVRTIHHALPREPTTIASIMAYLAPSRAVRDGVPEGGWKDQTFSFGRYMGYDETGHVGVEIDPYVSQRDGTLATQKSRLDFQG